MGRSPSQGRVDGDLPEIKSNHCLFQGNTLLLLPEFERQGELKRTWLAKLTAAPF